MRYRGGPSSPTGLAAAPRPRKRVFIIKYGAVAAPTVKRVAFRTSARLGSPRDTRAVERKVTYWPVKASRALLTLPRQTAPRARIYVDRCTATGQTA